jgi:16S rRNA (guanine966-N2)-methyltransferase
MRIIAGRFKGRKLKSFEGEDIRPTSDRTRESIFNLLMHGAYGGAHIIDQHVMDICCGTGALALEAMSRGAAHATLIDQSKKSLELARDNAMHCGVVQQCDFITADATRLPKARQPAALVLIDAPYAKPILNATYDSLKAGGWLEETSLIVSEQSTSAEIPTLDGCELIDTRQYGKVTILVYQFKG